MPWASSTGAPKRSSSCFNVAGASAALHDRTKRNPIRDGAWSDAARTRRISGMVGTAEYQVTECASTRGQKAWALGDRRATGAHDEHDGGEHSADHGLPPCRAGPTGGRGAGN